MTPKLSKILTINLIVALVTAICFSSCSSDQTTSHSTEDSVRVLLTKQRLMEGPVDFVFQGDPMPAIRVRTTEKLETETEGFTETKWSGVEIFAQGLGLVYYKKIISKQFVLEYSLAEVMSYPVFQTQYLNQGKQ